MRKKDKKEEGGGLDFVIEPLSDQELEDVTGGLEEPGASCKDGGGCGSGAGCGRGGAGEAVLA